MTWPIAIHYVGVSVSVLKYDEIFLVVRSPVLTFRTLHNNIWQTRLRQKERDDWQKQVDTPQSTAMYLQLNSKIKI